MCEIQGTVTTRVQHLEVRVESKTKARGSYRTLALGIHDGPAVLRQFLKASTGHLTRSTAAGASISNSFATSEFSVIFLLERP